MVSLKKILEDRFGKEFPVAAGTTTKEDPLIITDVRDYVAFEYAISKFLLQEMGYEYKFQSQRTHNYEGRVVDELIYDVREPEQIDKNETRSFFFDISAGFNRNKQDNRPSKPHSSTTFHYYPPKRPYESRPTSIRSKLLIVFRWVAFLPIAIIAMWLATRFLMFFRFGQFQQNNNPYVVMFVMQAVSGSVLGWVGVKIAPTMKTFALFCCSIISAMISAAYFLKFNDLLGGLAAATGFMATVIAGIMARDDD